MDPARRRERRQNRGCAASRSAIAGAAALALVAALLGSPPAYSGSWHGGGLDPVRAFRGSWLRPTSDRTGLVGRARFESTSFSVSATGVYEIQSTASFPHVLVLYAGEFSSRDPLRNLLAVEPPGFEAELLAGVVYHLVVSTLEDAVPMDSDGFPLPYRVQVEGFGEALPNVCTFVDEKGLKSETDDGAVTEAMVGGDRFCTWVEWRDFRGQRGVGRLVPHRSLDSVLFWFFSPDNWELSVKVLDGCAINGHYWVFLSAATDVEFTLSVKGLGRYDLGGTLRTYRNDLGELARAGADLRAFPCPAA